MENNPVMQRVTMLTEHWRDAVMAKKDARVFAWVGNSSVDIRLIKGFVMYHTSEESKIPDLFFNLNQSFDHQATAGYGEKMIADMMGFLGAWNEDADLVAKTGTIDWNPVEKSDLISDERYFISNIERLADALGVSGESDFLTVALLPQAVYDYGRYSAWMMNLIKVGVPDKVRFMLFDTYEMKAFENVQKAFPKQFEFLYPDLDMNGAMGQILENAKSKKSTQPEKDAISFQQALIKMNEAISYSDEANVMLNMKDCLQLSRTNAWPHLQALTYFFLHSFYITKNDMVSAHRVLDDAISLADEARANGLVPTSGICLQYRIAKGNLYFMNNNYPEAAVIYRACLALNREGIDNLVIMGVYQMLANCIKKSAGTTQAWPCFREGWSVLGEASEELVRGNVIIRFYAKDMMETANRTDPEAQQLFDKMEQWWGKQWMEALRNNTYDPVIR